jgi:cytochrome b
MQTMENIFRVVACLVAGAVLASLAYVSLSTANASPGWYYGIGLSLAAVTAFRVCVPTAGVPVARIVAAHRKRRHDDNHLPRQIH